MKKASSQLLICLFAVWFAQVAAAAPNQQALIICGLSGDDEYKEQFVETVSLIRNTLIERFGFQEANVRIQFGHSEEEEQVDAFPTVGSATRDEIAQEAERISAAGPEDRVWVFVLGQSYSDGKHVSLNLPDADVNEEEFGELFRRLKAHATFVISAPASGHFIKSLSGPNRIIMTSAANDSETNGSVFHIAFGEAIRDISTDAEFDVDQSGEVSILDLYVQAVRKMTEIYYENDPPLIPTEHPLLEDDGDGRGSELQIDYLTMAQGGRSDSKRKRRLHKFKDGKVAASIALPFAPAK